LEPGGYTTAHWCQETLSHDEDIWPCCEVDIVLTNLYLAPNGSFALVLVNHGEHTVAYRANVTLDHVDMDTTAAVEVVDTTLPAMTARVIRFKSDDVVLSTKWPATDAYGLFIPVQSGRSLAELVPVYRHIAVTKRNYPALPIVVQAEPCCFPLYDKEIPPYAPADYLPAVQAMRDAGVTVLWYVPTLDLAREKEGEYCCSPLPTINHWIDLALRYHSDTHTGSMLDGVFLGLGRIVALYCRSSALYQIH
jgi:hypothetical protein